MAPKISKENLRLERTETPPALFEQPLEILASRDAQGFAIDAPEQSQAEAAQAMPIFGFGKQRFHPHFAFTESFLVSASVLTATNPLEILLSHITIDATPLVTSRTLHFAWAVIADRSRSAIELTSVGIDSPHPLQHLALRTAILISLRFIAEVGSRPDLIPLFPIRQGNIGPDACIFQGFD